MSKLYVILSFCLFSQLAFAAGVFDNKVKERHFLSGAELNKIKAEHKLKFSKKNQSAVSASNNPWEKKKQQRKSFTAKSPTWAECRDNALNKRNFCHKKSKRVYGCEIRYEARINLCDNN